MFLPDSARGLDFQTLFQIVATFEGFSMWKGRRAFRLDLFSDIGGAKPKFNDAEWDSSCEHLKSSQHKFIGLFSLLWNLICHWASRVWHAILGPLLFIARWLHKVLVFLLRSTPIFTIPLFSFAYLYQWGFSQDGKFDKAIWIAVFIAAKTICYFVCGGLALFLARRVSIDVPAPDEPGIDPAPKKA